MSIEKIRNLPCEICLKPPPSDVHHWKTRGSGGSDDASNLHPLCRAHHNEFHSKGRATFLKKYKSLIDLFRKLYRLPKVEDEV